MCNGKTRESQLGVVASTSLSRNNYFIYFYRFSFHCTYFSVYFSSRGIFLAALSFMGMSCRRPSLPNSCSWFFLCTEYTGLDDDDDDSFFKRHVRYMSYITQLIQIKVKIKMLTSCLEVVSLRDNFSQE